MEPLPPPPDGVAADPLGALLDSLDTWTAIAGGAGRIEVVNGAWAAYEGPNPFVAGQEPGGDYGAQLQRVSASPDGNLSIVAMGLKAVISGKVPRLRLEFPIRREQGTLWFGVSAVRIGERVVFHYADLTERMGVMQRLHKVESLFKATSEHALDLISVVDASGNTVFTSHSHAKVLGFLDHEWKEVRFEDLIHPEDRELYRRTLKDAMKAGLSSFFEYRIHERGGRWLVFEGRAAVIDSNVPGQETVLLISRDITSRKQAEMEKASLEVQLRHAQKLEAVGQLAAGIAHELNTPTQYISDNVRFLEEAFGSLSEILKAEGGLLEEATRDTALAGRAQEVLSRVQAEDLDYLLVEVPRAIQQSLEGLTRVSSIVKAMKIFSHPGAGGQVALDLNQAVENTCLVARNEWKYVSELEMGLEPGLPAIVAYPGEINQMILNLIINAAHAIEAVVGGTGTKGRILVTTARDGEWVELGVEDTGSGIPEAIREQVFLPFFTTKPVGKGTGQGLAIVHSVVTKHGGTVDFRTEEGKGTRFRVRLPIAGETDPA
jgi:two-component system, NtrC family, sensor kinase